MIITELPPVWKSCPLPFLNKSRKALRRVFDIVQLYRLPGDALHACVMKCCCGPHLEAIALSCFRAALVIGLYLKNYLVVYCMHA